ncbi:MAG TPA: Holliday junction resolvase RuvX [Candidatus Baltobacteraceae bacterium]|jgi:putative Holliday junction resolvase|nr:Holliday junction resolvase RuvX [Candidatus Baltobacteraceae bacterium]
MRVLAIDHGTKRVGLALSDETETIAQPLEMVAAQPAEKLLGRIAEIVAQRNVREVVVGLPRNMNGTFGPAAEKAREFVAALQQVVRVPVNTWDERLTSVQANRFLIESGVRREKRREKVDQTAAAILLQSYLDKAGG